MNIRKLMINKIDRRQTKDFATNLMGALGLIIALAAILLSQDQAALISQLSQDFTPTVLSHVIGSIKAYF